MEAPFSNKNQKHLKAVGFSHHLLSFLLRLQQILSKSTIIILSKLKIIYLILLGELWVFIRLFQPAELLDLVLERSLGLFPSFLLETTEKCDSILLPPSANPKASLQWRIPPEARRTLENREKPAAASPERWCFSTVGFFTSCPWSAQQLPSFPSVLLEMSLIWMVIPKPATRSLFKEEPSEPFRGLRSSSAHKTANYSVLFLQLGAGAGTPR